MKAAVLIATYNEAENIDPLLQSIFFAGERSDHELSVVVVDDNSPDGTGKILEALRDRFGKKLHVIHRMKERGCGTARRLGFKYCQKLPVDFVVEMDGDGSHNPKYIPLFLDLGEYYDVVIGSRYVEGGVTAGWPVRRRITSTLANTLYRLMLGTRIHDLSGGYKCYRKKVIDALPFDQFLSTGYSIGIETLFRCFKMGFTFLEVPVFFHNRRRGASKFRWKEGVESLRILAQLLWRFGRPIRIYDYRHFSLNED